MRIIVTNTVLGPREFHSFLGVSAGIDLNWRGNLFPWQSSSTSEISTARGEVELQVPNFLNQRKDFEGSDSFPRPLQAW
jgi:hypothetical protein